MKRNPRRLKHIPALSSERLEKAVAALGVTRMTKAGKMQVEQMLRAASNPNAERIDVVIASLEKARRGNVEGTHTALTSLTHARVLRGKNKLNALSEAEWARLVQEDGDA